MTCRAPCIKIVGLIRFLARFCKRRLNQALSVLCIYPGFLLSVVLYFSIRSLWLCSLCYVFRVLPLGCSGLTVSASETWKDLSPAVNVLMETLTSTHLHSHFLRSSAVTAFKKDVHNRQHSQTQLLICHERPTGGLKMSNNHLWAGALPRTPLGSTQRSPGHLAGGEEACWPLCKNPTTISTLWAWLPHPIFFWHPQFRFPKNFTDTMCPPKRTH